MLSEKQQKTSLNMAHPPPPGALTCAQIRAFVDQGAREGGVFTMIWSRGATPNVRLTWKCTCRTVSTGPSRILYVSENADPDENGAEVELELPSVVEDGNGDAVLDNDQYQLDYVYWNLTWHAVSAKKKLGNVSTRSTTGSAIVAHNRKSWEPVLEMEGGQGLLGRELLISQLKLQLAFPDRTSLRDGSLASDHERVTLGEALLGVVDLLQSVDKTSRALAGFDKIVDPLVRRLLELKIGDAFSGAERTAKMQKVREAFLKQDFKEDDITLMLHNVSKGK